MASRSARIGKRSADVRGAQSVELICEFRGPPGGVGEFDTASLRLTRKGSESKR